MTDIIDSINQDIAIELNKKNVGKKRINSIVKGKNWERKLSKILTESLGINIVRIPGSGSFSTTHDSEIWSGDLMCPDKDTFNPFNFEAKHYRAIDILDVLKDKKTNKIFEWIDQSERDAQRTKTIPIIVFRLNNSPIFVMSRLINFRKRNDELSSKPPTDFHFKDHYKKIIFVYKNSPYAITPFDNFNIKEMYEELKNLT